MSMCSICNGALESSEDTAFCTLCEQSSHPLCNGMQEKSWICKPKQQRATWRCKPCRKKTFEPRTKKPRRDSLDSITSGRSLNYSDSSAIEDDEMDIDDPGPITLAQMRKLFKSIVKPINIKLQPIQNIQNDVKKILVDLSEVQSRVEKLEKCNADLEKRNAELESKVKELENRPCDRQTTSVELSGSVDGKFEAMERYTRRNNIVVTGLPVCKDENPFNLALDICNSLDISLTMGDIDACHRLPTTRGSPPFIIKFVNRHCKEAVISKARKTKLTQARFGGNTNKPIFINEHLTKLGNAIFREAKQLKKCGYKYIWTRNSNIYAKSDSQNARAVELKSLEQVRNMLAGSQGSGNVVGSLGTHLPNEFNASNDSG